MRGFPEGGHIDQVFGVVIKDPKGPARPVPTGFQAANMNVITDVNALEARHEGVEMLAAVPEIVAVPSLLDNALAEWIADVKRPGVATPEPVMSQKEIDEVVPGIYEVVPHGLRRIQDEESSTAYEAAKYKRSRHRKQAGKCVVSGMVKAPVPAEFPESAEAAA